MATSGASELTTPAERDAYWGQADNAMGLDASVRPYENFAWPPPVAEPLTKEQVQKVLDYAGFAPLLGTGADIANAMIFVASGEFSKAGSYAIFSLPLFGDAAGVLRVGREMATISRNKIGNIIEFISDKNPSVKIWAADGYMSTRDIRRDVDEVRKNSDETITIFSGVDGHKLGHVTKDSSYYPDHVSKYAHMPNVEVVDVTKLSDKEARAHLKRPGTKIMAFCNGTECIDGMFTDVLR